MSTRGSPQKIEDARSVLRSFIREQLLGWKIVPIYVTAISLFSLTYDSLNFTLSDFFKLFLIYYNDLLRLLLTPFEWFFLSLVELLSNWFSIELHFGEEWRHPFTIMSMYFVIDLRAGYLRRKSPWPTILTTAIFGVVVAVAFSLGASIFAGGSSALAAAVSPVLGFAVYEFLKAPTSASYMPITGFNWRQTFLYYVILYGITNLLIGWISVLIYDRSHFAFVSGSQPIILVIFLFLICIRNIIVAFGKAFLLSKHTEGTRLHAFLYSGSIQVASNVLYALSICAAFITVNTAMNRFGL